LKRTAIIVALLAALTLSVAGCGPQYPEEDISDDDACLSDAIDKLDDAVKAYRQATYKQKHEAGGSADRLAEAAEEVLACQEASK
jgi:outer membrane murein-binding lipoprotein Lpp